MRFVGLVLLITGCGALSGPRMPTGDAGVSSGSGGGGGSTNGGSGGGGGGLDGVLGDAGLQPVVDAGKPWLAFRNVPVKSTKPIQAALVAISGSPTDTWFATKKGLLHLVDGELVPTLVDARNDLNGVYVNGATTVISKNTLLLTCTGTCATEDDFTSLDVLQIDANDQIFGLCVSPGGTVYAVGKTQRYTWLGTTWRRETLPGTYFQGCAVAPDDTMYIYGFNGVTVIRAGVSKFETFTDNVNARGLVAFNDEVDLVADQGIFRRAADGTWSNVFPSSGHGDLLAMGAASSTLMYAGGRIGAGTVGNWARFDGAKWKFASSRVAAFDGSGFLSLIQVVGDVVYFGGVDDSGALTVYAGTVP